MIQKLNNREPHYKFSLSYMDPSFHNTGTKWWRSFVINGKIHDVWIMSNDVMPTTETLWFQRSSDLEDHKLLSFYELIDYKRKDIKQYQEVWAAYTDEMRSFTSHYKSFPDYD